MLKQNRISFRETLAEVTSEGRVVRVAGVHNALGGMLAQEAGFDAVWSSSFEVSAARALPDASILTMTEYLDAARHTQMALKIPVIADCDTGYGGNMNVAHMVREYEAAGITAVCMEDKLFPKNNSFSSGNQTLLSVADFSKKIEVAQAARRDDDLFVIARTEALIAGLPVEEALLRADAYASAGADAILIHSKSNTKDQVLDFLDRWGGDLPIVIVPTTYPAWSADEIYAAGVSTVIYANQGLRSTVTALRDTFAAIQGHGDSRHIEHKIASISDIFDLQQLAEWQSVDA